MCVPTPFYRNKNTILIRECKLSSKRGEVTAKEI